MFRSTSVLLLTESTIWGFSSSSGLGSCRFCDVCSDHFNQSQYVMVDGCQSKLVNMVSAVSQGSVFGSATVAPVYAELFSILEKLYGVMLTTPPW